MGPSPGCVFTGLVVANLYPATQRRLGGRRFLTRGGCAFGNRGAPSRRRRRRRRALQLGPYIRGAAGGAWMATRASSVGSFGGGEGGNSAGPLTDRGARRWCVSARQFLPWAAAGGDRRGYMALGGSRTLSRHDRHNVGQQCGPRRRQIAPPAPHDVATSAAERRRASSFEPAAPSAAPPARPLSGSPAPTTVLIVSRTTLRQAAAIVLHDLSRHELELGARLGDRLPGCAAPPRRAAPPPA